MRAGDDIEAPIGEAERAAFARDGAVRLRGCVGGAWIEALRRGVERNMREPGPYAEDVGDAGEGGRFFTDYCNWQRIAEYRDFVLASPAAAIAGRLMGARRVQIFHDHVLVKEPGAAQPTPWHHDMPYYCVEGHKTVSLWLALDPVPEAVALRFVAGSHRWGELYYPRLFADGSDYPYAGEGYRPVPDIDAAPGRYRVLSWALEPGDAVAFHFLTLHSAPGNSGRHRRRGFSTRWLGEDARYKTRPARPSPPFPGIGLADGEALREDWFPVVWPQPSAVG